MGTLIETELRAALRAIGTAAALATKYEPMLIRQVGTAIDQRIHTIERTTNLRSPQNGLCKRIVSQYECFKRSIALADRYPEQLQPRAMAIESLATLLHLAESAEAGARPPSSRVAVGSWKAWARPSASTSS
jgi:hypothetical protein